MAGVFKHVAHLSHFIHAKHEKEKRIEEQRERLSRTKEKLNSRLEDFLQGKHVEVRSLSKAFLQQSAVVYQERRKLSVIQAKLDKAKKYN